MVIILIVIYNLLLIRIVVKNVNNSVKLTCKSLLFVHVYSYLKGFWPFLFSIFIELET